MEKKVDKINEQIEVINAKLNDRNLCAGSAELYQRVSGYYRPVSAWNDGKQEEQVQRTEYKM